ncbi:hypothetical protein E4U21_003255 [Claviceps maximensis]|nr:hypothetical protein E4U21_003255 [Claviceps maximensis]
MVNDIDPETLELILELHLQDWREIDKGKHKIGQVSDAEVAAQFSEDELRNLASFQRDKIMVRSIARAVVTDGDAIAAHISDEQQASNDEKPTMQGQNRTEAPSSSSASYGLDDDTIQALAALYMGDCCSSGDSETSSSTSSSSAAAVHLRRCVACKSDVVVFKTVRCPCSHDYCRDCMTELFMGAINDESLFPPRCCETPIPLDLMRLFLSAKLLDTYKAKELEYATPNRTYCYVPTCSAFVPPTSVQDDVATCVECQSKTCTMCKDKTHTDDCPADTLTADVLRIAAENGWQRCYSCRGVIDLIMGCNHIICRCKAEFCYICGVAWKNCNCERWDEARIIHQEEQ